VFVAGAFDRGRRAGLRLVSPLSGGEPVAAAVAALSAKEVDLYSDLALHDMGEGLADGISQGQATSSEFRTAPLWGLGQRIFFLHDGRTRDLKRAIQEHRSSGSEANRVVRKFFSQLSQSEQQDILNFLRSL
jgi:CxxC motif-containing protein (DUF1111 family)